MSAWMRAAGRNGRRVVVVRSRKRDIVFVSAGESGAAVTKIARHRWVQGRRRMIPSTTSINSRGGRAVFETGIINRRV